MNFDPKPLQDVFGKTLGEQLSGTAISTDGLRRFSTDALLGELKRRTQERSNAETQVDSWLPVDQITEKYFRGMKAQDVATYLGLIGHPYRLQPKLSSADFSLRKLFLEDTIKVVATAFEQNSRLLGCDGDISTLFHPFVGRYERVCITKWECK